MQDTHWASGLFGYFPSYALGNIYDGIWLSKLNKNLPDRREKIEKGSFKEVKEWLTEEPFISYLDDKFSRIYA
jgi:carboxypeptidase Taq